jgi:bifunctional non-homologous end joining protein LigD
MKRATPAKTPASEFPVNISHADKVFWPDDGYTKGDLARYYQEIFSKLEPYVDDRILSMERCPDGMLGSCFYQKEMPRGMPAGTPSKRIKHVGKSTESTNYVVGGSLATQLALVNLGCIAVHVAGTRASAGRKPDWVCFDLDPQSGKFSDSAQAAIVMKEALDALKLTSYAKTSGSRGVHIFIPIRLGPHADEVLSFAQAVVARVAAAHPKDLTVEHSIAARGQRVYLDPFRNGFGQTVVAPYSVRRRPKAPFSTPLEWPELKPSLNPADFNLGNYGKRFKGSDPWKDFFKNRQSLKTAAQLLKKL